MYARPALSVGNLRLRPGAARGIEGARALPVQVLLAGRIADEAPALLGRLFALCGCAHELAARLALGAAREGEAELAQAQRAALRHEILREHLRHLWIDWPLHLAGAAAGEAEMTRLAALWRLVASARELRPALATELYGCDPATWLHRRAQGGALEGSVIAVPLRGLAAVEAQARGLRIEAGQCLESLTGTRGWSRIAESALLDARFTSGPRLDGATLQTGPFARCSRRRGRTAESVFDRLLDRLEDLALLVLEQGLPESAAINFGPRLGLAWVDTARGRLMHVVALDARARILEYRVIAPTEWNFHPEGAIARALAKLPRDAGPGLCSLLAMAGDPCVGFTVECAIPEPLHA